MHSDKTTINDLSIFHKEEEYSLFRHINFTHTNGGREYLKYLLERPLDTIAKIQSTQQIVQRILFVQNEWPQKITNGTVMVIEKYYETALENLPQKSTLVNSACFKILNPADFSLTKYSVTHFIDFLQGIHQLSFLLQQEHNPEALTTIADTINLLLQKNIIQRVLKIEKKDNLSSAEILEYGRFLRYKYKREALELVAIYNRLDAYHSMAIACKQHQLKMPVFTDTEQPFVKTTGLYHLLLHSPVAYDIALMPQENFLFLTGANMAGKSTFIKALGVAVYLAHIGMGVPAASMELSLFDGILSNIEVGDNIAKGESYFFNEVQRIKKTIEKISDGKKWLILIDELFKGTNVQDAMKCSTVVIEGLRKMSNALFVLSTHLYEISESLQQYDNIQFRYFETMVQGDQLLFSYHLKHGVSNDRLGYLILRREGVVSLLEKL